jgi:hypothetical protein|tara:strand:+ start:5813 stop:6331 length:519 start_codon:yes stop_codon:yes gene_type:complete
MAFINNSQDNFKKSDSAWGDDNVTYYDMPNSNSISRVGDSGMLNTGNMSYQDIEDMITQISSVNISDVNDRAILEQKLNILQNEKSKRDELENVSRVERDDSFEKRDVNDIIKEDVVVEQESVIDTNPTALDNMNIELDELSTNTNFDNTEDKTNEFIIAALIVILVIKIIN